MMVTYCNDISQGTIPAVLIPGNEIASGGSLGEEMFVWYIGEGETDVSLQVPERFKGGF